MIGSDSEDAIETVIRWVRTRERGRLPMATSYDQLIDDIRHSALLRRMLSGAEPLAVAPPRSYGQPWYRLVDEGRASGCELTPLMDRSGAAPHVAINESAWEVVERRTDGSYVVQYQSGAPLYVATRSAADPSTWDLRRLDISRAVMPAA
jgi:hypothetical protein